MSGLNRDEPPCFKRAGLIRASIEPWGNFSVEDVKNLREKGLRIQQDSSQLGPLGTCTLEVSGMHGTQKSRPGAGLNVLAICSY